MNWFYYDEKNTKHGPVNNKELRKLAESGIISRSTDLETEDGKKGKAWQAKGLFDGIDKKQSRQKPLFSRFIYYDFLGRKHGPFEYAELKPLVQTGLITPETRIETNRGDRGKAAQILDIFPKQPEKIATNLSPPQTTQKAENRDLRQTIPDQRNDGDISPQANTQSRDKNELSPTPEIKTFCTNCGNPVLPQAVACMKCGADPLAHKNFCRTCGAQIKPYQIVCIKCGSSVEIKQNPSRKSPEDSPKQQYGYGTIQKFTNKINAIAGGEGEVELRLRDLFKGVFKHHSTEEAEKIFICGTESTTPVMKNISSEWPAPWLFSRVALCLFVAFVILKYAWSLTENPLLLPNIMFIGACIVPFSIMIFFFEANIPQNISFFKIILIFFVGGCASLLCTLILFKIVPNGMLDFFGAAMVGIVEETGKMLIVAFFISKMRNCVYILNGMLVGSAVGAGFDAFESAGYAFRAYTRYGYDTMASVINIRALTAPGGHMVWAAITGAAIMTAISGKKFSWKFIVNSKFLRLFALPIILHATWDMPISSKLNLPGPTVPIVLITISWIIVTVLLHIGLKEIQKQSSLP